MARRLRKDRIALLIVAALLLIGLVVSLLALLLRDKTDPRAHLEPVDAPAGAQLLLFPIDNGIISAGYKNANYFDKFGYPHYGLDITVRGGDPGKIVASGEGVVLGTEHCENNLGHIAVILYSNVYIPHSGETVSLVARYYHMTTMELETGDRVAAGQLMGTIDRSHAWYNHVHIELDTDLAYPFHTPQVADSSSELLHRYPANGEQILEPIQVLVVGLEQSVVVSGNSILVSAKDQPLYGQGGGQSTMGV